MNFVKFPVSSTTIFPAANSNAGGQMLTETNQLSRETVANHSIIPYVCGPSYTHSLDDFKLVKLSSSPSTIYITGGTALVHGHFVQLSNSSTRSISIDLASTGLSGRLCIGLRAMYSNEGTIAASLKTENSEGFYEGIQVVVLPKSQFYLPEDNGSGSYTSQNAVNAHLKLGELTYQNGAITDVTPNEDRHKVLDGERISNIDDLLADKYVTKTNLDPYKLYVMSGKKRADSSLAADYWADGTGSLIQWDANPQIRKTSDTVKAIWLKDSNISGAQIVDQAVARYDTADDTLKLILPHKQVDGMTSTDGTSEYYEPKELPFPVANRATGTGGVLNSSWVNFLNGLDNKIATMYRMPGGKMRKFIDVLTDRNNLPKPPIAYYEEQTRESSYYDNRLQYSFNLLQSQVAQLNQNFTNIITEIETTWKEAVTADVTTTLSDSTGTFQTRIDKLTDSLSDVQGNIADTIANIQDTRAQIQTLTDTSGNLSSRVTVLENRWMSTTPESADEHDQAQDVTISRLETKLAELQAEVETVQGNINVLVNNLTSTVNTLYSKLYGVNKSGDTGDIKDAVTAIEQLRSQYEYLYDAIHDLYNGITSEVERSVSTLESRILASLKSSINSQIAAIADQYDIDASWSPGDYVLVATDQTVMTDVSNNASFPSTMYVVVPGMTPLDSKYVASYYDVYTTDLCTPINTVSGTSSTSVKSIYNEALDTYDSAVATVKRQVPARFVYGYELGSNDVIDVASEDDLPDVYNSTMMLEELHNSNILIEGVRGTPGKDYFVLRYRYPLTGTVTNTYTDSITGEVYEGIQCQVYRWKCVFFTLDLTADKLELDTENPIILSGGTPYAEEARVGGFLNVGSDVYGGGYVSRDEAGHLRLNDFELLAAGVSAYQLGEDRSEGSGLDISELQEVFDQYVNQRIAFLNDNQLYRAAENNLRTDVITIDLNIGTTSEGTLNIYDIDSRFNTAVHLKITGGATENVILNIANCQRLRISMDQTSSPTIFLSNVCLYYDADIIDRIAQIDGLSLWYSQWEETDPPLEVDGMTVIYQGKLEPKGTKNFWTYASGNDNSYAYALRQLTFANDGTIIGMGIAITDNTTNNVQPISESIFASTFTLPQSIGLAYPVTKMTKQIKVTGNFITAYYSGSGSTKGYSVKNTNFTVLTQKYLKYTSVNEFIQGVISFYTKTTFVEDAEGVDGGTLMALNDEFAIDGWESGAYHIFYGGVIE